MIEESEMKKKMESKMQ